MNTFSKILLDVHPDAIDLDAIDHAAKLAIKTRSAVKVLHVVEDYPEDLNEWWNVRNPVKLMGQIVNQRQSSVNNVVERLKKAGVERVESGLRWGREVEEITQEVVANQQELVMTTTSRAKGWLSSLKKGCSCIASLCRYCPSSIWVTRNKLSPLKHIVVALDAKQGKLRIDGLNAKMLSAAATIAEAEGGELHIVHAFSQKEVNIMRGKRLCRDLTGFTDSLRSELKNECDALLQGTSISLNPNNIHLVMGSPATVIPEFVIEYGMDLIVMGTVGHRTIRELVEGNVSEQVMSQVGCNVLIVKPDDFVSPMALDDAELNSRQVA